ncbi:MAG: NADH-quinone oxidoreductase subunit J [Kofleriaceae bacterium]
MTRVLAILVGIALVFGAFAAAAPSIADAADDVVVPLGKSAPRAVIVDRSPHGDIVQPMAPTAQRPEGSKSMALLFWLFAAASVGGALFVVTRRNLIAAVMGMVGSFLGISAVYMMLYASFLSVVQMLVYAGAIMVLFVFVVMILNRPEDEPVAPSGRLGQALGGLAIVYLVSRLIMVLVQVRTPREVFPNPNNLANPDLLAPANTPAGHSWGSVKAVGTDLFGPGLFPFEAISILLLVAVVGAIAIARPLHEDPKPEAGMP